MGRFLRHVFICQNERPEGDPRGSCLRRGSADVRDRLKAEIHRRGLSAQVRANTAGCLDACAHGTSLVIYPEGIWYGGVTVNDVVEIVERTIINGEVIQRLLIGDSRYEPGARRFGRLGISTRENDPL